GDGSRSEEHTSELQSLAYLVCRLLLEKKNSRHSLSRTRRSVRQALAQHAPLAGALAGSHHVAAHVPRRVDWFLQATARIQLVCRRCCGSDDVAAVVYRLSPAR